MQRCGAKETGNLISCSILNSLFLSEWWTKGKMSLVITEVSSTKGDMKCLTARSSLVDVIAPFQLGSLFPSLLKSKKQREKINIICPTHLFSFTKLTVLAQLLSLPNGGIRSGEQPVLALSIIWYPKQRYVASIFPSRFFYFLF